MTSNTTGHDHRGDLAPGPTASGRSHVLDNPAWPALTTVHAHLAEAVGPARRYPRSTSFFAAVERLDAEGWEALGALAGDGGAVVLARCEPVEPPEGWSLTGTNPGHQLVARDLAPRAGGPVAEVRVLGPDDVPAMLALTRLTRPGPFFPGTPGLGRYVGIEEDGELIAMAGERLRLPGYTEVSAVCTHPDARGRGLAATVTMAVASAVVERGDTPFLHVAEGNDTALRLYQRLGFVERARVRFNLLRAPTRDGSSPTPSSATR